MAMTAYTPGVSFTKQVVATRTSPMGVGATAQSFVPVTRNIAATGNSASIDVSAIPDGAPLQVTLAVVGSVTSMVAQVENVADQSVIALVFHPNGSGRKFALPVNVTNIRLNCTSFFGTGSINVTVGAA